MTVLAVVAAFLAGALTWDGVLTWLHAELDQATALPDPDRIDVRA